MLLLLLLFHEREVDDGGCGAGLVATARGAHLAAAAAVVCCRRRLTPGQFAALSAAAALAELRGEVEKVPLDVGRDGAVAAAVDDAAAAAAAGLSLPDALVEEVPATSRIQSRMVDEASVLRWDGGSVLPPEIRFGAVARGGCGGDGGGCLGLADPGQEWVAGRRELG